MAQKDNDLERIQELLEIMKENDLVELEISHGHDKIKLKRAGGEQPVLAAMPIVGAGVPAANGNGGSGPVGWPGAETAAAGVDDGLVEIKSPMVGTFYGTPSPDSDAFVEVDSQVDEQTVVCIIEAMKVMNEIKAEMSGTIAEILVKSGEAVEFGQVLFKVKPD